MKFLILFFLILFLAGCRSHMKPDVNLTREGDFFATQRFGANFFNEKETLERMMAAKRLGLDIIRLTPSKWPSLKKDAKPGEFLIGDQQQYRGLYRKDVDELLRVLDMAERVGLKIILTFLNVPGRMWKQHNNHQEDCRLWTDFKYHDQMVEFMADVSIAVSTHKAMAAINPINEPNPEHCVKEIPDWADKVAYEQWQKNTINTPRDLNLLYEKIAQSIRKFNRSIPIVFDAGFFAAPPALPFLKPLDDAHVLYSLHMYEPYHYTFQKTPGSRYPGISLVGEHGSHDQNWDKEALKTLLLPIKRWQIQNHVENNRILIGEFGVDRMAHGAENYLGDLLDIFNENNWHWAFYSFRENGFTKFDYEMGNHKPGWKYWQALEQSREPNHRLFKKGELLQTMIQKMGNRNQSIKPVMGWNSWNWFGRDINEKVIEETIEAISKNGLKEAGYEYVVIDGGWADEKLHDEGYLLPHPKKFPGGIKRLSDLAHQKGLRLGLHVSAGTHNCGSKPIGSLGREALHLKQLTDWKVDFIKLDQCLLNKSEDWPESTKIAVYQKWHELLKKNPRPILLSMSAYRYHDWYPQIGSIGRTTMDLRPRVFGGALFNSAFTGQFLTVMEAAEVNNLHHTKAGLGYWNDPDMLVVGDEHLTHHEQVTHFALWAIMSAPLMLGLDVRSMNDAVRNLVQNPNIIAIDQDPYQQGYRIKKEGDSEVWRKLLSNGNAVFLLINLSKTKSTSVTIYDHEGEMVSGFFAKDIYTNQTLGRFETQLAVTIGPNQSKLIVLSP